MTGQNSTYTTTEPCWAELVVWVGLLPAPHPCATPRPSRALKDRRFTPDSCHEGVIPGYQLKTFDSSGAAVRRRLGSGINFLKVTLSESVWQLLDASLSPKKYWCAMIRDTGGFVGLYECSVQCYSMPKRPIRCHNYDVTYSLHS